MEIGTVVRVKGLNPFYQKRHSLRGAGVLLSQARVANIDRG